MNDRFKFRFYDKNKKIVTKGIEEENDKKIMINENSDYSTLKTTYGQDEWWWCVEAGMPTVLEYFEQQSWDGDKDFVIMQCTGLKDKNGKLIYEGDIINDKSNHIRVVVWEQDCFKYPALKTSRYFHRPISNKLEERKIDLRAKLTFQDAVGKCDKKHFEVIGNIYENNELLESEG